MKMNFSFGSFSLLLLVALVSIVLYDPDSDTNDLSAKFSYNLKKWHSKGNYFMYKEQHKIFYVYEEYENKKTNEKQKEIDDEDINSQITIVFLHGFPTASYDFLSSMEFVFVKLWRAKRAQSIQTHLIARL